MVPKRTVTSFVKRHKETFYKIQPSFFEMTVGLAFDYFREEEVDIAVVEVGMGGRLDSTNIITPLVSVITNISFDHMQFLGDTLEKIAGEKAGIIKPGVPVVIGETQPETEKVFQKKAGECGSPILFADQGAMIHLTPGPSPQGEGRKSPLGDLGAAGIRDPASGIKLPLLGFYQLKNLVTTLAVIEILNDNSSGKRKAKLVIARNAVTRQSEKRKAKLVIARNAVTRQSEKRKSGIRIQTIRRGIANVITNTGLQGRWHVIGQHPLTIADTGHNEAGIREVVKQLLQTPHKHLHIVFGQVNDKETGNILALLPKEATYYFCKANIPRGLDAIELKRQAMAAGLTGRSYGSVRRALAAALKAASSGDLVFVGGSTFVVAEVIH
jgi:dihydrofolate synthase/folylpolyglutamate synthase